jgi:aryl-alcohol dehydrogenase-like predicted oxidoreductase
MIPKAIFGRTGHLSSRVIFGSWALSNATQNEADQILELLLEYGINHIDTAQMYGNAEKLIGSWMLKHRSDFFLATKTRKRTHRGAVADLHQSLRLLGVDTIDLWQMHSLTGPVGWETAMGPGGTLEVFTNARQKGHVRFLGVTGHGNKAAAMHLRSLERFDFDSVLLPYSYAQMQDSRYAQAFSSLMSTCSERHVAVQTIKAIARRPWHAQPKTYNTYFYEPLDTQEAIEKSVHWVLGNPGCFLVTAGDMRILPKILQAADRFTTRPSEAEMSALVSEYAIQPIFSN